MGRSLGRGISHGSLAGAFARVAKDVVVVAVGTRKTHQGHLRSGRVTFHIISRSNG